ncbi:hypothetical protein B0H13DRAFT_1913362 [Mycena leptocephala]|nr:hypothetical protein B0H13DRAFT_1913362 [Mycena leptocephala]
MSVGEQIARNFLSPKRASFDASPRDRERLALVQGCTTREALPPRTMYGAMRAEGRNSGKDFAHPKLSRILSFTARASLGSAKAKLRESLAVEQNSALTMRVVEQAQWGGTRKSAKYKKRGGDIREDLYPNVIHFLVSADAYPLPKYARPGREPPLETWGHVNIHEVWIPLAKVVCCGRRALCRGTRSRSEATAGIGARKYGGREDSGNAGHKVIKGRSGGLDSVVDEIASASARASQSRYSNAQSEALSLGR